ncbi:HNH endonuclease signature motif containing protein [Nocardioides dongkuii]|uniref:HNH endonuclease signature motif containing protein n=1 Tax=Nocardioides dongkuii TaxID=2760089 RepID=UPI00187815B4|nr:HNH endonuclease signature motif containing protein [Nocardioides dongkuii]
MAEGSVLEHPVRRCTRAIGAALDEVSDVDPAFLPVADRAELMVELTREASRLRGLALRLVGVSDDVAAEDGARSAASWLAHRTRSSQQSARADGRLAEALEQRWRVVQAGVLSGSVHLEQAEAIVRSLDGLPADVPPDVRARAEALLVEQAADFGPRELRVLGCRVLEVVDPEAFEGEERRRLEDEDRRAKKAASLSFRKRGDGTTDIRARVSDSVAARLRTYLEAIDAPRRRHLDPLQPVTDEATGERLPYRRRLAMAFATLLEAVPASSLPRHGGSATTMVFTLDHDKLTAGLATAGLLDGDRVSASEAMRLACNASIVPMVLGGQGQPLHLGRSRRLFSEAQRLAMAVRDGGCRGDGCSVPAAWCEAHHLGRPWCQGGKTDLEDGVLLCSFHHHRAHDPDYDLRTLASGDIRFHRRR